MEIEIEGLISPSSARVSISERLSGLCGRVAGLVQLDVLSDRVRVNSSFCVPCLPLVYFCILIALLLLILPFGIKILGIGPLKPQFNNSTEPEGFLGMYAEMERNLQVYIYPEGDSGEYFHTPGKLEGKYASEGFFFKNIMEGPFKTKDPETAHLFFIPLSCVRIREKGKSVQEMAIIVRNYVRGLISMYPYWNRTLGADHFFVSCHENALNATEGLPLLVKNSIRVVCSPGYDLGYIPHKDVALPQVMLPFALPAGGNDLQNRTRLGIWVGPRNSIVRDDLVRLWSNDSEIFVNNNTEVLTTGRLSYAEKFYRTKFCICPRGSLVDGACITRAIHCGCIPVILSNFFDLPYNDVLNWQKFSVILTEGDVPQLKHILKGIPYEKLKTLHNNLMKVQRHFQWNSPPVKYDAFHMVMFELWLRHNVIRY